MPKRIIEAVPSWLMMCIAVASILVTISVGWGSTQERLENQEKVSKETSEKLAIIDKEFNLYKVKQATSEKDFQFLSHVMTELTNSVKETNILNRQLLIKVYSTHGETPDES